MYPLAQFFKFVVAFLYRWAIGTVNPAHPWGCHCEKCMTEYNAEIKRRRDDAEKDRQEWEWRKGLDKKGSVSDADLLSALTNLGYRVREAQMAINELGAEGSFEERFKRALQFLRRTRGER